MPEFDDMPPFARRTWRQLTRWLRRNNFEMIRPQEITRAGIRYHTAGSSIWYRRRPQLRTEAVRIDILGHVPRGFADLQIPHPMDPSVIVRRVGFGDIRHFHKESIPAADEVAYLAAPTRDVIRYDDQGNALPNGFAGHADAHIPIEP